MKGEEALRVIQEEVCACRKCPRLVKYREKVAREKRRAYREWTYWGRGVPGFGDARAEIFILGLAPAAHGGNRTGVYSRVIAREISSTRRCTKRDLRINLLLCAARMDWS